jgi:hypothetical protein
MRRAHVLFVALIVVPLPAGAVDVRARYEEHLIDWALASTGLRPDPQPAGKLIERIEIARENIIAPSDPWPRFLNVFHLTTRDFVIRRELLVAPGEVWNDERIEESARNLRQFWTLAVVRAVACQGSAPDRVVLLVVTKDLWSIRLNTNWSQVGTILQALDFLPAEENFLGRAKSVRLHARLQQLDLDGLHLRDKLALGAVYYDPRLAGTRLQLRQALDVLIAGDVPCGGRAGDGASWCPAHRAGDFDGLYATFELQRPLFSLATEWAFEVWGYANARQVRRFVFNPTNAPAPPGQATGLSLDTVTFDDSSVPAAERRYVPRVYDTREFGGEASVTRSLGRAFKHDLAAGLGVYRHQYAPPAFFPFDDSVRRLFVDTQLPWNEDAAYLLLTHREHAARFVRLRNIQAFALTEDFLLGHDVRVTARPALNLADADQSFLELGWDGGYRWYVRDDLIRVWATAETRWQPRLADLGRPGPWANTALDAGVKNVTPRFWVGRLHLQVHTILRHHRLDNATSFLGGDTGLRGYSSNAFEGPSLFRVNAEYRTDPINLWTLHLGLVAFADGGSVFGPDPRNATQNLPFRYYQSVGAGLRAMFPQFDKYAVRVDFGVPLRGGEQVGTWFSFAFMQVF